MKKIVRLTESDLARIVKRVIKENEEMKHIKTQEQLNEKKLGLSGVINRLSDWNTGRVRKKERMEIYNQYKDGKISYEEYVKQRTELEKQYKEEDEMDEESL